MAENLTEQDADAGEKQCSFCGRYAGQVSAMVRSMRTTGQPAYICNECVSKYTRELADGNSGSS